MSLLKSYQSINRFSKGFPIFSLAWSKYFSSRRRNISILAVLGLPVLLSLLMILSGGRFSSPFAFSLQLVGLAYLFYITFAIMIVLFFATYITTDEISDQTISYLLHSPISRADLLFWKFLCFLTYSIVIFFFMEIMFFIFFSLPNIGILNNTHIALFISILEVTFINILLYGSFFFLVSVITNRPIVWGLIVGFADQILLGTVFPNLFGAYSLSYHVKAIATDRIGELGPLSSFTKFMNISDSYLVVIVLVIVFILLSLLIGNRKEFN